MMSEKKSTIQKLNFLLSVSQKKQLIILAVLMFIGMLFEMAGLGILIPALSILLDTDLEKNHPEFQSFFQYLNHPSQFQLAVWGMLILILVYLTKAIFLVFLTWRQSKFTFGLSSELSKELFLGYLKQPYSFHLQRNSALLLRNIQYEVAQFTTISSHSLVLITEFSVIVSIATVLLFVEPIGAISVTLFLSVAALVFLRVIKKKLLAWGSVRQFHGGQTNKHLLQGLGGVKDVKVLGREEAFSEEYVKHNKILEAIEIKVNTVSLIPRFYLELLSVVGLAGLIIMMVVQHKPLGVLMPILGVFVVSSFRMIPSVNRIIDSSQRIRFAVPVVDLLYEEFSIIKAQQIEHNKSNSGLIFSNNLSVHNVTFNYDGSLKPALNKLNLDIKKGSSVGLIGSSGSGKSTLVDLILGLLTPNSGQISFDGHNISDDLRNWQNQIGYVPQTIYLTDDTLRKNIAFGIADDDISDQAINKAIKSAQLEEFVSALPAGLDTFVGERGVRLSGGQRQRIGIARALYHDPSILVLDEATSALDATTEKGVMQAVNDLKGMKTLIIVAHRLSTLANCNIIYKLENGVIIEHGAPGKFLSSEIKINSGGQ